MNTLPGLATTTSISLSMLMGRSLAVVDGEVDNGEPERPH